MKRLLLSMFLILLSAAAHAHEIQVGNLVIVHPTVDEAQKGQAVAQGSMEIRNQGKTPDRLLSISAEFAETARIESTETAVPPGGRILVPVVFEKIKRQLSELEVYDGELIFEKAGTIKIEIMVHPHAHTSRSPVLALLPSQPALSQSVTCLRASPSCR
jgi:periplasmic copper chaperone A